jgi:hypothetical protein
VPALEPAVAWRVVATPAALDAARWEGDDVDVVRLSPDEALGLGATGVQVDDPDAIVEQEAGFSSARLTASQLLDVVAHIEWEVPDSGAGRSVAQGKIAGTPAKLVTGEPTVLVVQTCHVDDLRARLGW